MKKIAILVPCYNVELVIKKIILKILKCKKISKINKIIFLDNCSKDNTSKIIKDFAKKNNKIILIQNKYNLGYGGSLKVGFNFIEKSDFSHCAIIHSDNQTNVSQIIDKFLDTSNDKYEFILASRFYKKKKNLTQNYNLSRKYANVIFSFLFKKFLHIQQTDIGSGIIYISKKLISRINYKSFDNDMLFHIHLNIVLNYLKINKIEIPLIWKDSKIKSNTHNYKIGIQISLILIVYFIKKNIFKKSIFNSLIFKKKYSFSQSYKIIS